MRSFKHFNPDERYFIALKVSLGVSAYEIAQALGRHPSSVYREIKRNESSKGYNPWHAFSLYRERRKSCIRKFRLLELMEWEYIKSRLEKGWTPEQIAVLWAREHPEAQGIGKGTIYRAVRKKLFGERITPNTHLRRGGKPRGKTNRATIKPDKKIEDRPLIIEERGRLGDLEGDTLRGGIGKGCLVTLVDRKNRKLYAVRILTSDKETTREAFRVALDGVEVHSITLDNGSEFAAFREIEKDLGVDIYFTAPHSPWQRGSNENTNGLLRFYFPKGTDFRAVSDERVREVVNLINNRPRKCLGWLSPIEFAEKCRI